MKESEEERVRERGDIETERDTEIDRNSESERNLEIRVEVAMPNILK